MTPIAFLPFIAVHFYLTLISADEDDAWRAVLHAVFACLALALGAYSVLAQ